jgi:hypothetical protein
VRHPHPSFRGPQSQINALRELEGNVGFFGLAKEKAHFILHGGFLALECAGYIEIFREGLTFRG